MVLKKLLKKIVGRSKKDSHSTSEATNSTQAVSIEETNRTFVRRSSEIEEEKTEIEELRYTNDGSNHGAESNIESLDSRSQQEMLDEQIARKLQEEEDSISASSFVQKYKESKPKTPKTKPREDREHAAHIIAEREQRNNDMFDMYMQYYYR